MSDELRPELEGLRARLTRTLDDHRGEAAEKRHARGYRTARENLEDPNELVAAFGHLVSMYPDRRIIFNVDCGRRYDPFAEAIERKTARPVFRSIDDAMAAIYRYEVSEFRRTRQVFGGVV